MQIPRDAFRAYDIRGEADPPRAQITPDLARAVGAAFAGMLREHWNAAQTVVAGDLRATTPALRDALIDGIRSAGADVVNIGDAPSPLAYWAAANLAAGERPTAAAVVTASHNPRNENGIKFIAPDALPFLPEHIAELADRVESDAHPAGARVLGGLRDWKPAPEYAASLAAEYALLAPLSVALDPGNAVAARTAPPVFTALGADIAAINLDPSQNSHTADPAEAENVRELERFVRETGSQIGFAFDGDGDRLGVVLPGGRANPHAVLALLARIHLERHPGAAVHLDVKTSRAVFDDIRAHGGDPIFGRVGHSFAKRAMSERDIALGGEASTHYYLRVADPPHVTDDAVRTAALLANRAAVRHLPAELAAFPHVRTSPEIKIDCPDDRKFAIADLLRDELAAEHPVLTIDGVRAELPEIEPGTWLLIRPSNTAPVLTIVFEARTDNGFAQLRSRAAELLDRHYFATTGLQAATPLD